MIAQDQDPLVTEIVHDAFALLQIERNSFVIVIGDQTEQDQGLLIVWQQSFLHTRNRVSSAGVGMKHRVELVRCHVYGAVNGKAGRIDGKFTRGERVAFPVDFYQG